MKDVYTLDDLRKWAAVTAGLAEPIRLAVLGDPVIHSASPPMHNAALAACQIPARYSRFHLREAEFAEGIALLARHHFLGANCTIPHKFAALKLVDQADEHARRIGVVNTIVFQNGRLIGHNTDGPGLVRAIRSELGVGLAERRVLVLGAGGGAGRAVAMQCAFEACERLVLVNRTVEKIQPLGQELAEFFPPSRLALCDFSADRLGRELSQSDLVINCTSVGMKPEEPSPIPAELLGPQHLLYDTIYTSDRTPLMRAGDVAGARSANGLSMLLHQGALSFEIWFGRPAPLEIMRAALLAQIARR